MKTKLGNRFATRKIIVAVYFLVCGFVPNRGVSQNVTVAGAIAGNGTYADLNSAFAALNTNAQTAANISVTILGNTTETITAVLNSGAWSSLSITPQGSRTVTGNIAGPLVDLNGAGNVTVNGINSGGNDLTFSNTNTLNIITTTFRFGADASNNLVTNCVVLGSCTSATLGVITFSLANALGNNSNTITLCEVGPAGSDLPVNCIYSASSGTLINSNNVISSCKVRDFYSSSLASAGILLETANSGWTISGNHIYQTAARTYTTANTHKGIYIGSGNGYSVNNNIVGYSSSVLSGFMAMNSAVATRFVAIEVFAGTVIVSSVSGNTVTAITLTTSSSAATANGIICGIRVASGNANIHNNLIGGTSGTNLITGYPTTTQGMVVGINSASTGTISVQGNYIGGCSSSGITAAIAGGISGINVSAAAGLLSIMSNTIGNPTANNMRAGTNGLTTGNSLCMGINLASAVSGTALVSGNLIQNMASYGTGTAGTMRGIMTLNTGSTTYSIVNNVLNNLTTNNTNTALSDGLIATVGIVTANGNTSVIDNNTISNISNLTTATTAVVVAGISVANGPNPTISNNRIFGLSNLGTSTVLTAPAQATGIFLRSSTSGTITIYNNMISLGNGQTSNTAFLGIHGFFLSNPLLTKIYFNTINIEGAVASGNQPSFGLYRGDWSTTAKTAAMDIKNNLIINTRSGVTSTHCAIANNYGATSPSATGWGINASDHNVLNGNAASIGWWGSAQTFAGWQSVSASDANSFSGIPVTFVNSANDLHLNMGLSPTYIESGAQTIPGITADIDSQVRPGPAGSVNGGAFFPDIGADEIDGVFVPCSSANAGTITPASYTICSGHTLAATPRG